MASANNSGLPTVFNFNGNTQIRIIENGTGQPWFVVADLGQTLGYSQPKNIARILDDDERGVHIVNTPSGAQEMTVCNESGMYHLILKSRREEAKAFRRWVTGTVLPALRERGVYENQRMQVAQMKQSDQMQRELIRVYRHALRAERRKAQLLEKVVHLSQFVPKIPTAQPKPNTNAGQLALSGV